MGICVNNSINLNVNVNVDNESNFRSNKSNNTLSLDYAYKSYVSGSTLYSSQLTNSPSLVSSLPSSPTLNYNLNFNTLESDVKIPYLVIKPEKKSPILSHLKARSNKKRTHNSSSLDVRN